LEIPVEVWEKVAGLSGLQGVIRVFPIFIMGLHVLSKREKEKTPC